jgi:uncharacterized protein (DUF2336 family)
VSAAEQRRSEDQTAVFHAVTGIFRKRGGELSPEKRRLLLRLLRQIGPETDLAARRDLARALADDAEADRDLVRLLLDDHIEVARPLLEKSLVLTQGDLLRLLEERGSDFQRVLAARPGLPGEVCAVLAERGEPEVIKSLLANTRARISGHAFATLAQAARRHPELRGPLRKRADLPADLARELAAESAREAEKAAAALAAKLHRAGHLRASVLVGALRQRQIALFEHAFALLTGLAVADLRRLLRDRSGFPLALAARAARMDRSAFSTVFVNYCEARGVSPRMDPADFACAMDVFRNLPQEGARAELHRLARRPKPAARRGGATLLACAHMMHD